MDGERHQARLDIYQLMTDAVVAAAQQEAELSLTYCQREKEAVALFKQVKARLIESGLTMPDGRFHLFRCTRVTRLVVIAGMPLELAGRSVGHRSITTTEAYFAPSQLDVIKALAKAEARLAENATTNQPAITINVEPITISNEPVGLVGGVGGVGGGGQFPST